MDLQDTGPRILLAALLALLLFVLAFFLARGGSSEAALAPVREKPAPGSTGLKHTNLRPIGDVPALPRAPRKPKPKPSPKPDQRPPGPITPPPAPPPPPRIPPPPPPPPPAPPTCIGEGCP